MVALSSHAALRGRERLNLRSHSTLKLADDAWRRGLRRTHFSGALRRYLDAEYHKTDHAVDLRVHASHVFVFGRHHDAITLITVWRLPNQYQRTLQRITHKPHPTPAS